MARRNSTFRRIGGLRPGRSVFDLSHEVILDCDMGQLIPVLLQECVPGDSFKIGNEMVVRFKPLLAPILHEVNVYVHYFFVPTRIVDCKNWEDFITGGEDGKNDYSLPRNSSAQNLRKGTIWDYMGLPIGQASVMPGNRDCQVISYPQRAYNLIWNEYYRDQNLQDPVRVNGHKDFDKSEYTTNYDILYRNWEKDYFTSALPWQQRGTAPALPFSGFLNAEFYGPESSSFNPELAPVSPVIENGYPQGKLGGVGPGGSNVAVNAFRNWLSQNRIATDGITFDVNDMRTVFQIQKWLERNARAGVRYTEFLKAHFGVSPRDERLDRPEYIGGSKSPLIVSEVLQTSGTDRQGQGSQATPQANMAGHGISANSSYCGSYFAQEFGYILGIMSIMPRTRYQNGINRMWLRRTRYDFYFPEFAHLSEQAIEKQELYWNDDSEENLKIFGYQGKYDEMRVRNSYVCNNMRDVYSYWHLGRNLSNGVQLNSNFISTKFIDKRIFAVQNEPGIIVNCGNIIRAVRPMPYEANPGYIDHF